MKFTHLTTSNTNKLTLDISEDQVFFLHNQSGEFTFNLTAPKTKVYVFTLFTGKDKDVFDLKINQVHNAPHTVSHATVAFLGDDESSLRYEGLIHIAKEGIQSEASQKNTNFLLSNKAKAFSIPSLEILTDDVICHHGSATSQINQNQLFYAKSRGINTKDATQMLAEGFINDFFEKIEKIKLFQELETFKKNLLH